MNTHSYDLLSTVENGGCSAKLDPNALSNLLNGLPLLKDQNIMVDIETHDDAGVYRINETMALIVTTDFFPPVCSDPYIFGKIAATNSLSDVYAMGGTPLLALNLNMFPSQTIPLTVLKEILTGGQHTINEAGAFTMGGHTIDDDIPKYGLAVVGIVHPDRLITNSGLRPGQKLLLTKPLGTGILMAAHKLSIDEPTAYEAALEQMQLLNKQGAQLMQAFGVKGATDITGFGLLGHAMKMAQASHVSIKIKGQQLPMLPQVSELIEEGCLPGAAFRNLKFVESAVCFSPTLPLYQKMVSCDAQTSGGLLMGVDADRADELLAALHQTGLHPQASIIGEVVESELQLIYIE